ncbi:Trafficking protein particle complex subunit 10 [Smittium mucronatum]|uniref:Trafficking protein particle complex subunit 10 n=1 Tax=Smittium mucronatum TaxID=133383 RepID=A0A1R0GUX5_9FUNG|nr:Trafficking protein particle complex subunit 10 [Smittium mucronatum]
MEEDFERNAILTYQDDFGLWENVKSGFQKYLPLRDVVWKGPNGVQNRLISELDVNIVKLDSSIHMESGPTGWQNRPFLNILFVGNSNDNDSYKAIVKPCVHQWINQVSLQKTQEWLIVYITTEEEFQRSISKFITKRTTNLDRIRSDFQPKKDTDRVLMLKLDNEESWLELFITIKKLILSSFEIQTIALQTDSRRMSSMRHMPGWNYCSFFILKEALAHLYYTMHAYDDSLKQYDELEAIFHESLITNNLSWFKGVGVNRVGADNVDLLRIPSKEYRELIIQNDISPSVSEHFISSWIYSTCQNSVEICESNGKQSALDPDFIRFTAVSKAELLHESRRQLEYLGGIYGRLPSSYYSVSMLPNITEHISLDDSPPNSKGSKESFVPDENTDSKISFITNLILLEALKSESRFDQIFSNISEQAIEYYEESSRQRFANLLKRDIAQLHLCRGRYQKARAYYEQLIPESYDDSKWQPLHTRLLMNLATCQSKLEFWPSYLNSIQILLSPVCNISQDKIDYFSKELVETSRSNLTVDYEINMTPFFEVKDVYVNDTDENIYIDLLSVYKKDFKIDLVSISLVSTNSSVSVLYSSEFLPLNFDGSFSNGFGTFPASNLSVSAPGIYQVSKIEISIGKALFSMDYKNSNLVKLIRLRRNPSLPCSSISSSKNPYSWNNTCLQVCIDSKHVSFQDGRLSIFGEDGRSIICEKTKISKCSISGGSMPLQKLVIQEGYISVPSLEQRSIITLELENVNLNNPYDPLILETCLEYVFKNDNINKEGLTLNRVIVEVAPSLDLKFNTWKLRDRLLVQINVSNISRFPIIILGLSYNDCNMNNVFISSSNLVGLSINYGQKYSSIVTIDLNGEKSIDLDTLFKFELKFAKFSRFLGSVIGNELLLATYSNSTDNGVSATNILLKNSFNFLFELINLHILSSLDDHLLMESKILKFDTEIEPVINLAFGNDSKKFRRYVKEVVNVVFKNLYNKYILEDFERYFFDEIKETLKEDVSKIETQASTFDDKQFAVLNSLTPDYLEFSIDVSQFLEKSIFNLISHISTSVVTNDEDFLYPVSQILDISSSESGLSISNKKDILIKSPEGIKVNLLVNKFESELRIHCENDELNTQSESFGDNSLDRFRINRSILGEPVYFRASIGLFLFSDMINSKTEDRLDYSKGYNIMVNICFNRSDWLISGPSSQIIMLHINQKSYNESTGFRNYSNLDYCLIPLRPGFLTTPTFECYLEWDQSSSAKLALLESMKSILNIEDSDLYSAQSLFNSLNNDEIETKYFLGSDNNEDHVTIPSSMNDNSNESRDITDNSSHDFNEMTQTGIKLTPEMSNSLGISTFDSKKNSDLESAPSNEPLSEHESDLNSDSKSLIDVGVQLVPKYIKISTFHENSGIPLAVVGRSNFPNTYFVR